jgi:hypothetical protein
MLTPLHKQSDSISDLADMRALPGNIDPSSGTFWGDLNKRNLLASGARLAVPAAGAGIGALLNAVRGKSIARGAGVGALTGAGLNLGADVGSVVGGIPAQAAGGELAAFAGPGVGTLAGGAGGGYGGYQLGQSLFGPEKEKRDGDGDGTINDGTPEEKQASPFSQALSSAWPMAVGGLAGVGLPYLLDAKPSQGAVVGSTAGGTFLGGLVTHLNQQRAAKKQREQLKSKAPKERTEQEQLGLDVLDDLAAPRRGKRDGDGDGTINDGTPEEKHPADRELFATTPEGKKIYRQNWRWEDIDEHGTEREHADFVDEDGNKAEPIGVGSQIEDSVMAKYGKSEQPADQTPRHDCHVVHPDQTHEEWKASLEKEASTARRFYIDVTPDLVKYAQYTRKQAAWPAWMRGGLGNLAAAVGGSPKPAPAPAANYGFGTPPKTYADTPMGGLNAYEGAKTTGMPGMSGYRVQKAYNEAARDAAGQKQGSVANDRFYIDVTPDLVKYAQDKRTMRKIAGLYHTPTTAQPQLTENQLRYNQNAARILASGVAGIGIGGLASLVQYLRHPDATDMVQRPTEVAPALHVPTRKHIRRKPEDEETEVQLAKAADAGLLGDENWQWPPLVAGTMAAGYGGYQLTHALGKYLAEKKRKRTREQAVADATEDYETAIAEQFEGGMEHDNPDLWGKVASVRPGNLSDELDVLQGVFYKVAQRGSGGHSIGNNSFVQSIMDMLPSDQTVSDIKDTVMDTAEDAAGKYTGFLTGLAGAVGVPAAMVAYNHARKRRKMQTPLAEAMRRRRTELARRRPAPIYITPGEEIVHEEDDPAIESV